eukprot:scaffold301_cov243-Pinguiococcus_pyrenoidosus.AAC.52
MDIIPRRRRNPSDACGKVRESGSGTERNLLLKAASRRRRRLLAQVQQEGTVALHLLLQLEHAVQQTFGSWRAARHVDVHGHDAVAPADHCVRVVIVATAVGAGAHGHHPPRLRHLVVHFPQRRCHLVGQRPRDDHHVRLARRRTEDHAKTLHIVARRRRMHHLHRAAGEAEGHRPQRSSTAPVDQLVDASHEVLYAILRGHETVYVVHLLKL